MARWSRCELRGERMRRRWIIMGLIGLLLLALGAIWLMSAPRPPALELAPLRVERKQVGKLPPPPAGAGKDIYYAYTRATLVDFDGDGAPELLALGEVLDGGFLKPTYTAWLSLRDGAVSRTPLIALMPSMTTLSGDLTVDAPIAPNSLPLAREVIAWDRRALAPLLLKRTNKGWQTEPLAALKGERLQNALAFDLDKDGLVDNYLLQTQTGKLARLTLDSNRRIQLQKLLPSTPPAIETLLRDARSQIHPPVAGATPLPTTIADNRLKLPDLDGDGKPEWIEEGDIVRRTPARLTLSRTQRRVALPFEEFSLSNRAEAIELDGVAPLELAVVAQKASTFLLSVYRVERDALQLAASMQTQVRTKWLTYWLRDLDGDGRAELILADLIGRPSRTMQWRVFRYENGAFRQVASQNQRTPYRLGGFYKPIQTQSGLLVVADINPPFAWLTGEGGEVAVLATLPKGADALNPANWQFTLLPDLRPVWYGDYDSNGVEEILLSGWFSESYLIQIRDGKPHGAKLSESAITTVLPTQIDGTPWLVVVYRQGIIELVRIQTP